MGDRRLMWTKGRSAACEELVVDCEAFLSGHLAETLESRTGYVPVWTWTNLLAHGSEAEIEAESAGQATTGGFRCPIDGESAIAGSTGSGETADDYRDRWHPARSYLATEVLAVARRIGSLRALQNGVLVPLELALANHPSVEWWSPTRLVTTVETALGAYHPTGR
jgi:hypothetical protein